MEFSKCLALPIWALIAVYIALHSPVASAAAEVAANVSARSYEDCRTTKMILLNNYEFKGLQVYKFFRGTGSARDCSDRCRSDLECYSFNYVKLTKWCFLGDTHKRYLRSVESSKMAAGYRQCSTHSTNEGWTSQIYTAAGAPTSLVETAKSDSSVIITYTDGTIADPLETYSAKCVAYGSSCSSPAIGISLSYPRSTQSIPVSGLAADTQYSCYVVASNTVATVCSPALAVTTCAAGLTC